MAADDLIKSQRGGKFSVEVQHMFGGGNTDLMDFLRNLDASLRRDVIRKMVNAAGAILVKEIRKEIDQRDMPYSRAKGKTKKTLRAEGSQPLKMTIGKRVWSKPHKGIIGCVVGPQWPAGAHGHLAEFGHRITGRAITKISAPTLRKYVNARARTTSYRLKMKQFKIGRQKIDRSGDRTRAHLFQTKAMESMESQIYWTMASKMKQALDKAGNPHLNTAARHMFNLAQEAEEVF